MARPLGLVPTDEAVKDWMRSKGINPNDVTGYAIDRQVGDVATIKLTMLFAEDPAVKSEESS
jgi:hypothetical protein